MRQPDSSSLTGQGLAGASTPTRSPGRSRGGLIEVVIRNGFARPEVLDYLNWRDRASLAGGDPHLNLFTLIPFKNNSEPLQSEVIVNQFYLFRFSRN